MIWYVSMFASDDNDCQSESAPCKNLHTVLDRVTDGSVICVLSYKISLDGVINEISTSPGDQPQASCFVVSENRHTIRACGSVNKFSFTCFGKSVELNCRIRRLKVAGVVVYLSFRCGSQRDIPVSFFKMKRFSSN